MTPKTIIFTGAPDSSTVCQTSKTWLTEFTPPISDFLGKPNLVSSPNPTPESSNPAAWRSLPFKRQVLQTNLSQRHDFLDRYYHREAFQPDPDFFTTASVSHDSTIGLYSQQDDTAPQPQAQQEILSQFYDQSLAEHQNLASSQLPPESPIQDETTSHLTKTASFDSEDKSNITADVSMCPPLGNAAVTSHLSDIEDIPPAKEILALAPGVVTVNLIAGIISIAAPRTVVTRWGARMSLVEMLLGDETKAGFGVTFWIPGDNDTAARAKNQAQDPLAEVISKLRRQDIVLLQNVALNVFKGKVYGQSLRKNLTKVHLLHRRKLDRKDDAGHYRKEDLVSKKGTLHPQLDKTRKVREWVISFVGAPQSERQTRSRKSRPMTAARAWDRPPDDTQ